MTLLFVYLIGALALSFMCSVLEAVLLSTPMSYINTLFDRNAGLAALMKRYKANIDRPVAAILSLNTIAHTIGAAGVGAQAIELWGEASFGIVSAVMTLLILVFSEIIPKTIGASYWRTLALQSTAIIRVMIVICWPLVVMSEFITRVFTPKDAPASVSREEVAAMVNVGEEEGVLKAKESRAIRSVLQLSNVTARDIMTPQIVAETAPASMNCLDFHNSKEFTKSRILIYDTDDDFITGYVLRSDLLQQISDDNFGCALADVSRPILSFTENEPVSNIWERMLQTREHISVIVDEYNCFRGIVTMEDVIETMLGVEIVDEHDTAEDMQQLARTRAREFVAGRTDRKILSLG